MGYNTHTYTKHGDEIKIQRRFQSEQAYGNINEHNLILRNKIVSWTVFLLFITSSPRTLVSVASKDPHILFLLFTYHGTALSDTFGCISCKPHLQRARPSHSPISWCSETGFAHVFNSCQCDDFSLTTFPRQQNTTPLPTKLLFREEHQPHSSMQGLSSHPLVRETEGVTSHKPHHNLPTHTLKAVKGTLPTSHWKDIRNGKFRKRLWHKE